MDYFRNKKRTGGEEITFHFILYQCGFGIKKVDKITISSKGAALNWLIASNFSFSKGGCSYMGHGVLRTSNSGESLIVSLLAVLSREFFGVLHELFAILEKFLGEFCA